jgi:adenylylsulfate kinase
MVWALWITGLPGSGKTTISDLLKEKLGETGIKVVVLGIDGIRKK